MHKIETIALYEVVGTRERDIAPDASHGVRPAEARETLLILRTTSGLTGLAVWPEDSAPTRTDLEWLAGTDPRRLLAFRDGFAIGEAPAYSDRMRLFPGIGGAVADLVARIEEIPLWQLLGTEARTDVPAFDSTLCFEDLRDDGGSASAVADRARLLAARGHRALCICIGRGLKWMPWPESAERDAEVCLSVREAVGEHIRLMASADGGFSGAVADAVDFLAATRACQFEWVEDLVANEEIGDLLEEMSARGIMTPVAAGASRGSLAWCRALLKRGSVAVLRPKATGTGLFDCIQIGQFASDHGLAVSPGAFGTRIGLYQSLHLGKIMPSFAFAESDDSVFSSYAAPGYAFRDGSFLLGGQAGLGVELEHAETAGTSVVG